MKNLILISALLLCLGCTENQRARNFGGSATHNLDPNEKLVVATWKQDSMWILTRPMREGEEAETYSFKESSSFGILEGEVKIVESK